jgi:acyl carrier protein
VQAGVTAILQHRGHLSGLVHCAGVIHDNFVLKKGGEEFRAVLAPKVDGLMNLDESTRALPLEVVILFSSIGSVFGNIGQGDYTTANAFLDWFAGYRNRMVRAGMRHGRTLAINWPLWADGGMSVAPGVQAALGRSEDVRLPTAAALAALAAAWRSGADQVAVVPATHRRLAELLGGAAPSGPGTGDGAFAARAMADSEEGLARPIVDMPTLRREAVEYLKRHLAVELKLPPERLAEDAPLEGYGIDSILGLKLVIQLERTFGALPRTLFFEYPSLEALAGYFAQAHTDTLRDQLLYEQCG